MAEYTPRMDADKTVPILPRPLIRPQDRIRAQNLTGDETGFKGTDDGMFWQGLDFSKMKALEAQDTARFLRDQEIDRLWG